MELSLRMMDARATTVALLDSVRKSENAPNDLSNFEHLTA